MTTPPAGRPGTTLDVVMYDRRVARIKHPATRTSRATLTYTDVAPSVTRGLSCCLPVIGGSFKGDVVDNWLGGLLPDRPEVLTRWRSQFDVRRQDPFALLWHVGQDVAGAARFLPADEDQPDEAYQAVDGDLVPLNRDQIAERVRNLRADAAGWLAAGRTAGKFSLAGAQAKFALAVTADDGWAESTGDVPTTHIFKPAIANMPDQDLNEHLTMRLAAAVGLRTAPTELLDFAGERVLAVKRFDRHELPDGTWRRLHQEDMVQALGMEPSLKYEAHRGPGVRQIAQLLRVQVTDGHATDDIRSLVDAVLFNWLVLGTDAHARNFALLHHGRQTRLAPLYDLNSFTAYRRNSEPVTLAMRVGFTEFDPDKVCARDLDELARDCGVEPDWVIVRAGELARLLLEHGKREALRPFAPQGSPFTAVFSRTLISHVRTCLRRIGKPGA